MLKGQLSRVPWPGNSLMPFTFSLASAAPQTFTHTPSSYSHSTSTSLHSLGFINSFCFFFLSPRVFLQSTMQPHQSAAKPLERAASHIKVTCPPCLFWLPPWENVNQSTTLIHCMWVMYLINYSWEKFRDFVDAVFPTLTVFIKYPCLPVCLGSPWTSEKPGTELLLYAYLAQGQKISQELVKTIRMYCCITNSWNPLEWQLHCW